MITTPRDDTVATWRKPWIDAGIIMAINIAYAIAVAAVTWLEIH